MLHQILKAFRAATLKMLGLFLILSGHKTGKTEQDHSWS
jgi:hypothetical protein